MNKQEFIKHVNNLRLENKGKWYMDTGKVNGHDYALKGYKTWIQVLRIDGVTYDTPMDIKVSIFKNLLGEIIDGLN